MAGQDGRPHAAAVYARISDDRTGEAAGVARQEADCIALAKSKGWPVAGIYRDNDVSAFTGRQRPEYQRLLADLRGGAVDAVVAYHPDRLHRSPRELEDFVEVVERSQAAVVTVKAGDIDLTTATGRQTARIIGAIARGESERMGERVRRAKLESAAAGRLSGGGSRAFGFEPDHVTVRPTEAKAVRDAARRLLAGESVNSIVHEWNTAGIVTAGGKLWDVTGLRRVLVSARISGRREHHGRIAGAAIWKGLISPQDSDRLRSMLGPANRRRSGPPTRFLLTGLLRCGRCGIALAASRAPTRAADRAVSRKYATLAYACSRNARSRPTACGGIRVRAAALEELVTEMLFVTVDSPKLAARVAKRRSGDKRATVLDVVADLEADLQRLAADFGEGHLPYPEWTAARGPLERRLTEARRRLDVESGTLPLNGYTGKAGALRKAWPELSLDRKRAILGVVFERITIVPANPALPRNKFDEDRVVPAWRI